MPGPFAANPKRVVLLIAAVAVVTGAGGWLVGTRVQSPADAAASHQPPPASLVTVPVERRTLKSTVVAQGTVAYGTPTPLQLTGTVGGVEGTQLITKAPVAGSTIKQGDVALEVSGRPVFVLTGVVPMYRKLGLEAKGDDVKQLQKALRGLGYSSPTSGTFDAATAAAVKRLYTKAGYDVQLEGDDPAKVVVPSGEILFLPKLPLRIDTVTALAGAAATGQIGMVTDSTVVVRATLPTADAQLLHAGLPAVLQLPNGTQTPGKLDALGKEAAVQAQQAPSPSGSAKPDSPDDSGPAATPLRFTATDPQALAAFSDQAVKVTVEVGTTGGDVLTVPVSAVVTNADGRARVRVEQPGGTRDVFVKLGLTAMGAVHVTPEGGELNAGDRVVVGTS
ncbi:peptidoglycan-binding domain-containing protein [Kibdelosporangium aridum]|uniref:Putative peptidoglycan binding domain-containing protein n=1 Tax=Kibdelosporangium aridum TaxID=2030 RepID=A0A1Y5WXC6_KIBAR|nr:peptidoglycan-binding domain-containing protein [Kibdelosporangium aridum]SMC51737.1 Putative peptidoglycan binding domain-containing protein [Kibdelosporangium aridum]